ncbi:hypothetical protein NDU88_004073 [Pleurodeles waltl]|uniref:Uncharacterized protein n=1 Tax=Pleurodeles waltl TaxID=8319 RepID=A0AAV7RH26_PLEWA|nr:hypothetical protein NDU88_004073 [Pleurodeles waltl]
MRAPPHAGRSLCSCRGWLHYARPRLPARGGAASLTSLRAEQLGLPLAPSPLNPRCEMALSGAAADKGAQMRKLAVMDLEVENTLSETYRGHRGVTRATSLSSARALSVQMQPSGAGIGRGVCGRRKHGHS